MAERARPSDRVVVKQITPAVATLPTQFSRDFPPDPPDRLIGATSRDEGLPLVRRDAGMRASMVPETIW